MKSPSLFVSLISLAATGCSASTCRIPRAVPLAFQMHGMSEMDAETTHHISKGNISGQLPLFTTTELLQTPRGWTYEPFCEYSDDASTYICAFTDISFSDGRGISIIATAESAQSLWNLKALHSKHSRSSSISGNSAPRYELKSSPNKGVRVLAKDSMARGDLLMATSPVLLVHTDAEKHLSKEEMHELFHAAIGRLPQATRELYMNLHAQYPDEDPIVERFETNGIRIFDFIGVVPELARLNHDCRPTAHYHFARETFTHNVKIVQPVEPGEEITISYLGHYLTHEERITKIERQWGFKCSCSLCSAPPEEIKASDRRLRRIKTMEAVMDDTTSDQRLASSKSAEELVRLYQQERLHTQIATAYRYAALEYSYEGNATMAKRYAELAAEAYESWQGRSNRFAREMQYLMEETQSHPTWRLFKSTRMAF